MTRIKFAHISDIHLGAWRNEKLNYIGYQALEIAIDTIIEEKVNFVLLSGNLYDVSNPKVDVIDLATKQLKKLKDNSIPVYGIMGSHDFSPSNKSMVRPLMTAGLFSNVSQAIWTDQDNIQLVFTKDPTTNVKITGLRARKHYLEVNDYKQLDLKALEEEPGNKLFLLHTLIAEMKPESYHSLRTLPKSMLPKGFLYIAAGHLHYPFPNNLRDEKPISLTQKNNIIYSGCLSPYNFSMLEEMQHGGYIIVEGEVGPQKALLKARYLPVIVKKVELLKFDCNGKSVEEVNELIDKSVSKSNFKNKLVLIRMEGTLSEGKSYEIDSNEILRKIKEKGAYEVLLNKSLLTSKDYSSIEKVTIVKEKVKIQSNEDIENTLINEYVQESNLGTLQTKKPEKVLKELLDVLGTDRDENVKVKDYKLDLEKKSLEIIGLKEGNIK